MVVVADTTPLNYLVLIQHQDLLPRLFGRVLIPPAVPAELHDPEAPKSVRLWLDRAPIWVQVQPLHSQPDKGLDYLDPGEREAIALAQDVKADQIRLDEAEARQEAARRKLPFIGALGVLRRAAQFDLIFLPDALARLQKTTFYVTPGADSVPARGRRPTQRLSMTSSTGVSITRQGVASNAPPWNLGTRNFCSMPGLKPSVFNRSPQSQNAPQIVDLAQMVTKMAVQVNQELLRRDC